MKIHFLGAGSEVTGSNYLVEAGGKKIIVDCGVFHGPEYESLNYEPWAFDPSQIDYVIITHGHLDHVGRLPKLVRDGFAGKVFCTAGTRDIAEPLLLDSLHIMSEDEDVENRGKLFEFEDLDKTLSLIETVEYQDETSLGGDDSFHFVDAGHILGSASVVLTLEGKKIVFSGDLGNSPAPILRDPVSPKEADYVVMESTYGDRVHESGNERQEVLKNIVLDNIAKKGWLIIPTFAVERAQELLYELNLMAESGAIPQIPIYLDSPLADKVTQVFIKHPEYYDDDMRALIEAGDDPFYFKGLKFIKSSNESRALNDKPGPGVVIAGSGMVTGGRVRHHILHHMGDENSTLLFVGFQAQGTLGRLILGGKKKIYFDNKTVTIRGEVKSISSFSAHADRDGLMNWVDKIGGDKKRVFMTHGEEEVTRILAESVKEKFGLDTYAPKLGEIIEL